MDKKSLSIQKNKKGRIEVDNFQKNNKTIFKGNKYKNILVSVNGSFFSILVFFREINEFDVP